MIRPPKPIDEAREFGRQIEQERKPGEKLTAVFARVRRTDRRRWGSERTMFRLWKTYREMRSKRVLPPKRLARLDPVHLKAGPRILFDISAEHLVTRLSDRTLERLRDGLRRAIDGSK
jgi:hypothetical protein